MENIETNTRTQDTPAPVSFPSTAWFQALADLMNTDRDTHEHLGFIDCVAQFTVLDGGPDGGRVAYQVTFEEIAATDVREVTDGDSAGASFALEAGLATWREMIENIAAGDGRPDLEHTLNAMSHIGTPIALVADDPLERDCYFRFNQSLQTFVNASCQIVTVFERA